MCVFHRTTARLHTLSARFRRTPRSIRGTAAAPSSTVRRVSSASTPPARPLRTPAASIGLGFAIPIDLAKGIADQLIAGEEVSRPTFGLQVQPISPELAQATGRPAGLFVEAVTAGGPADEAGLRPSDVIVEVDGEPAQSLDALIVKTLKAEPGDIVHLTYERLGQSHTTELRLSGG